MGGAGGGALAVHPGCGPGGVSRGAPHFLPADIAHLGKNLRHSFLGSPSGRALRAVTELNTQWTHSQLRPAQATGAVAPSTATGCGQGRKVQAALPGSARPGVNRPGSQSHLRGTFSPGP